MYASESISEILGWEPEDVVGKPWFEYFNKDNDDTPMARQATSQGIHLEKAAVIYHAQILHKDGRWITCECVFTVVHDVLVACTSLYNKLDDESVDYMDRIRGAISKEFSTIPPSFYLLTII